MITFIITTFVLGFAYASPFSRIVNGTDAELGEFPYIVSLRLFTMHTCGGSILSPNFILTAAHCVSGYRPSFLSIQFGAVKIASNDPNAIKVEKIAVHENYVPKDGYINDIAILKLASPVPLSERAQPVRLPVQEQNFEGWSLATLVGWGLPYTGGSTMKHLQKVNIFIFPQEECKKAHEPYVDDMVHVCAGVPEGGKGQCNGDSGGPLTLNGVQVGVVSWSVKPCTIVGYPGVFARVAHYINWIEGKMNDM